MVALGFGVWAVVSQWGAISDGLSRLSWPLLGLSLVAVVGALLAGMLMWRALLADLGSPLRLADAAKIFFIGQLGKYIPGSVWPVLAQMEMGKDHGIPRSRSAAAFFLTYPIYLATGLLVAVATLPAFAGDSVSGYAWLLLLLPVLAVGLHPKIVNGVLNLGFRLLKRPPLERPLTARGVLTSTGWAFAGWAAYGVQLAVIVHGLGATGPRAVILSFGAFSLAWCLGFVFVLAPAGAGCGRSPWSRRSRRCSTRGRPSPPRWCRGWWSPWVIWSVRRSRVGGRAKRKKPWNSYGIRFWNVASRVISLTIGVPGGLQ